MLRIRSGTRPPTIRRKPYNQPRGLTGVSGTGVNAAPLPNQEKRLSTTRSAMASRVTTEAEATCGSSVAFGQILIGEAQRCLVALGAVLWPVLQQQGSEIQHRGGRQRLRQRIADMDEAGRQQQQRQPGKSHVAARLVEAARRQGGARYHADRHDQPRLERWQGDQKRGAAAVGDAGECGAPYIAPPPRLRCPRVGVTAVGSGQDEEGGRCHRMDGKRQSNRPPWRVAAIDQCENRPQRKRHESQCRTAATHELVGQDPFDTLGFLRECRTG